MIGLTPLTMGDILAEETEKAELAGRPPLRFIPVRMLQRGNPTLANRIRPRGCDRHLKKTKKNSFKAAWELVADPDIICVAVSLFFLIFFVLGEVIIFRMP